MPGTATVTGVIGPGRAITAQVFQNVSFFSLVTKDEILHIEHDSGMGKQIAQIDVSAGVTWTLTVSGNTYTLTVANA
jgi:hypothetical protein